MAKVPVKELTRIAEKQFPEDDLSSVLKRITFDLRQRGS